MSERTNGAHVIEAARQQVESYEGGLVAAQQELEAFEAANGGKLETVKAEFEDYQKHPVWEEYRKRRAAADNVSQVYRDWHWKGVDDERFGWAGNILFLRENARWARSDQIDTENPGQSILPTTIEEFDRRAGIATNVGKVADVLHEHQGEPVISIASYPSRLKFDKAEGVELEGFNNKYWYGCVDQLPKTRVIVGTTDQEGRAPILTSGGSEERRNDFSHRLAIANSVFGNVVAYSLPADSKELDLQTTQPHYFHKYRTNFLERLKEKDVILPMGKSLIGCFALDALIGHDLLVIDGPHRTAEDYTFSDEIIVHRPKQKIEQDTQSRQQEVVVTPPEDSEVYKATVMTDDAEIVLPALRHDTVWLVGNKAIASYLSDAINEAVDEEGHHRGTHRAFMSATNDLARFAREGRSAAELVV